MELPLATIAQINDLKIKNLGETDKGFMTALVEEEDRRWRKRNEEDDDEYGADAVKRASNAERARNKKAEMRARNEGREPDPDAVIVGGRKRRKSRRRRKRRKSRRRRKSRKSSKSRKSRRRRKSRKSRRRRSR
jgi:hypothetical protein